MKKKLCFLMITVSCFLLQLPAHASRTTHALGSTGYMIREAMHAGAAKKDPQNYYEALKLQKEARQAFRGTHKKGRQLQLAFDLTEKAYALAKEARDNSSARYKNSKNLFQQSLIK